MAHPEIELVSKIVEESDFSEVVKRGLNPGWFKTEEGKLVFKWLWANYHDPKHRGMVPDRVSLSRKFPNFDYCPGSNPITYLISELREIRTRSALRELAEDVLDGLDDPGEDAISLVSEFSSKFRDLATTADDDEGILLSNSADEMKQEYETKEACGGITGIPYPWGPLNKATGGMQPEEWIVIYGRPKNMKTWMLCVIAAEAYINKRRVLVYSKEMSRIQMRRRIVAILVCLDYDRLKSGALDEYEKEDYYEFLDNVGINEEQTRGKGGHQPAMFFFSDKGRKTPASVDTLIAKAEKFRPDIICVDGFYLMHDPNVSPKSAPHVKIYSISRGMKEAAQYLEIPIVGSCQANRGGAGKYTEELDDVAGGDAIGQDADLLLRVYRGPHPTGPGAAVAVTLPGIREAAISPFLINAMPATNFSLLQKSLRMGAFLKDKARMEAAEMGEESETKSSGPTKKKKKKGQFRE